MRRTVLLLDGSEAMALSGEYQPNKLIAMRRHVHDFITKFFDQSPLALLSTVVLRDGVAHCVTGLTNDPAETTRALELRYFLQAPSGTVSIENGLRVAMMELVGDSAGLQPLMNSRIVVVLGAVSVVDPGDVMGLIRLVARAGVTCDVLSLVGAPHIAVHLTTSTGGALFSPLSHSHVEAIVSELAQRAPAPRRGLHDGDPTAAPPPVKIGFPAVVECTVACPRCHGELRGVPETCASCGLLVASVAQIHATMLSSTSLVPTETPLVGGDAACSLCGSKVADGSGVGCVSCDGCGQTQCSTCRAFVVSTLRMCPTCFGAAQ